MNFSQTLELMDENGVTAYKLIEESKRPANYGGLFAFLWFFCFPLLVVFACLFVCLAPILSLRLAPEVILQST